MKAEFTPTGGTLATLGDDAEKHSISLEALAGASAEQVEPLFRAASATRIPRGNAVGECVFTSVKSHASQAAAITFFKAQRALLNGQGALVLTEGLSTLTMSNATLTTVELAGVVGLRWWVRYRFGITTIT